MDPSLVLSLIERLPDDSMTAALAGGGKHLFGWGMDRYMQADVIDSLTLNTIATGNFKTPPKFKPYSRPKAKLTQSPKSGTAKQTVNLKQLHANLMMRAARQNG